MAQKITVSKEYQEALKARAKGGGNVSSYLKPAAPAITAPPPAPVITAQTPAAPPPGNQVGVRIGGGTGYVPEGSPAAKALGYTKDPNNPTASAAPAPEPTLTSYRDPIPVDTSADRYRTEAGYVAEFNANPKNQIKIGADVIPGSDEEDLRNFLESQQKEKSELEKQVQFQKDQALKTMAGSNAANRAAFATDREGITSTNREMLPGKIGAEYQARYDNLSSQLDSSVRRLDELQKQQQRGAVAGIDDQIRSETIRKLELEKQVQDIAAQSYRDAASLDNQRLSLLNESGALANLDQESIDYLSQNMETVPKGLLNALSSGATDKALTDSRKTAMDSLKFAAEKGVPMTTDDILDFADRTGLSPKTVSGYAQAAQAIYNDNKLGAAEKAMNIQKLGYEVDREARGVTTTEAKNLDYLDQQTRAWVDAGMDAPTIARKRLELLTNMGMKTTQDPLYQLEIRNKQLTNEALSIGNKYLDAEKSAGLESTILGNENKTLQNIIDAATAKYAPQTEIAKLKKIQQEIASGKAEMNQKYGISDPVYIPKSGKYTTAAPNGNGVQVNTEAIGKSAAFTSMPECGRFANIVFGKPGYFGNSLKEKLARTVPGMEPAAGMAFVMSTNGKSLYNGVETGHVGIIESVNADGTINTVEANLYQDGKIVRRQNVNPKNMQFAPPPDTDPQLGSSASVFNEKALAYAKGFGNEIPVKNYQIIKEHENFVNGFNLDTENPADDQGLIYAFAKVMDPNSVVRETEYGTVIDSNVPLVAALSKKYERTLNEETLLTKDARVNMIKTLKQKFGSAKSQYDNLRKDYADKLQKNFKVTSEDYLTDYSGENPTVPKAQGPSMFQGVANELYKAKNPQHSFESVDDIINQIADPLDQYVDDINPEW